MRARLRPAAARARTLAAPPGRGLLRYAVRVAGVAGAILGALSAFLVLDLLFNPRPSRPEPVPPWERPEEED